MVKYLSICSARPEDTGNEKHCRRVEKEAGLSAGGLAAGDSKDLHW